MFNKHKKYDGPSIQLPDNGMIVADRKGILPLSDELSNEAKTAMILPNLRSASLISMGQLCDDGCDVHFNEHALIVMKNKKVVMRGIRNRRDNLWDIPIQKRTISPQNYALPVHRPALHKKLTIDKEIIKTYPVLLTEATNNVNPVPGSR